MVGQQWKPFPTSRRQGWQRLEGRWRLFCRQSTSQQPHQQAIYYDIVFVQECSKKNETSWSRSIFNDWFWRSTSGGQTDHQTHFCPWIFVLEGEWARLSLARCTVLCVCLLFFFVCPCTRYNRNTKAICTKMTNGGTFFCLAVQELSRWCMP